LYFLQRVIAFPHGIFVLCNVEALSVENQEFVLFHICKNNFFEKANLHFIQCGESILQHSPLIQKRTLTKDDIKKSRSSIQEIVNLDYLQVKSVIVVSSRRNGSGKTTYIKKKMKDEPTTITINEGSSLDFLIQTLNNKFQHSNSPEVVHFSLMTSLNSKYSVILKNINFFFQSLLLTGIVIDPSTFQSFSFGSKKWTVYIELQDTAASKKESIKTLLLTHIPLLAYCASFITPPSLFDIDKKARRVCTYLRAFNMGTIDRKFQPARKLILFVLDKSGSMKFPFEENGKKPIDLAIDNAIQIFDSHVKSNDVSLVIIFCTSRIQSNLLTIFFFCLKLVGVVLFDHEIDLRVPLQLVTDANRNSLVASFDQCRLADGYTSMYKALNTAIGIVETNLVPCKESWIVCLTDGCSDNHELSECEERLICSSLDMNIAMIGINLPVDYQQKMENLCAKYGHTETKGLFIPADANSISLNKAFEEVAANIPVSASFDLDGPLTPKDCRGLIKIYEPSFFKDEDMLLRKCWIEFLYRRVRVFDKNNSFNYNEKHDNLGSSLMKLMLMEAEKLLLPKQDRNWISHNYEQLIYDFSNPESPEFRLICTAPHMIDEKTKCLYDDLDLPGFFIPRREELKNRAILDKYLSQALCLPLELIENGEKRLVCIDEQSFVLTLDFTMKLLNLHERVECNIPCIIEGETGVSKTALTKMYGILRNSTLYTKAKEITEMDLKTIEKSLISKGYNIGDGRDTCARIRKALMDYSSATMSNTTHFGHELILLIKEKCKKRSSIFVNYPAQFQFEEKGDTKTVEKVFEWFASSIVEETFFPFDVDASLTTEYLVEEFEKVQQKAKKISDSGAIVIVFLDGKF